MNNKGYTLIELVVVMVVFLIVIMISSYAFQNIVKRASQQGRAAETGVAGMVGLEMMRTDIGHAGFGLPWSFQAAPTYTEVTSSPVSGFEVDATTLLDNPALGKIPRAVVSTTGPTTGIDYLVVKGTSLGMNRTAKSWNFINYSGSSNSYSTYRQLSASDPTSDMNLKQGDLVATVKSSFTTQGVETRTLLGSGAAYSYAVPALVSNRFIANANYQPTTPTDMVIAYGINTTNISMPYNRVDFYVDKGAAKPVSCAPGTGVLYKAVANHQGGFTRYPLLDCVGDMKIVYFLDMDGDQNPQTYANAVGSSISTSEGAAIAAVQSTLQDAALLRQQLKSMQVYILTHEGKQDPNFSYPPLDATNAVCVAPYSGSTCNAIVGRMWTQAAMASTFGANWKNYRWKVYSFTVTLQNLQ